MEPVTTEKNTNLLDIDNDAALQIEGGSMGLAISCIIACCIL
jgi:hypothetical protein